MKNEDKHKKDDFNTKDRYLLKKRRPKPKNSPVREIKNIINDSGNPGYVNRLLVGTATTGLVRMEWVMARYGQIIPTNWSQVQMIQYMSSHVTLNYLIDDAQNMIVKEAIEKDFEWLFLLEHDVILPPDAFLRLNEYIREESHPVVSGLYYTKSVPAEPMIYRGRGNSFYTNWKLGDKVYADGVPTGCLLIHMGLLKKIWDDSPEYNVNGTITRRVFNTPREAWFDPHTGQYNSTTGTSDLDWCTKVIEGNYLEKSGWKDFAKKKYPFLVDTSLYCQQIDENGVKYP